MPEPTVVTATSALPSRLYELGYEEVEEEEESGNNELSLKSTLLRKARRSHSRVPGLRKIPLPALAIILLIAGVNALVWVAVGIVLRFNSSLVSTSVLSYTLGLRHALDADHISAIDLMTRRLLATGQRPVTVGTYFSLGHSSVVIITSIVVAGTAAAVSSKFDKYSKVGSVIGSSVSSAFLILLGIMNAYILYKLVQQMKKVLNLTQGEEDEMWKIEGGGVLFRVLKQMFKIIDRPWKMYPLGVLFGLGFDTSSEIALLGIASIQGARGTSIWLILIFPILFTGKFTFSDTGMCLIDTMDGALMLSLYIQPAKNFLQPKLSLPSSQLQQLENTTTTTTTTTEWTGTRPTRNPRNPIAFLYYSIVLTCLTVIVALVIGILQLLTLILNSTEVKGRFWDGVETAGEYYDIIGGSICACFVLFGGLSVVVYPYWRRWIAQRRVEEEGRGDGVDRLLEQGRGDDGRSEIGYDGSAANCACREGRLKGCGRDDSKGVRVSVEAEHLG
ncbi:hypothetical protein PAAG_02208 [Paracoccidioides lutzii Pb01]|uniref:Nickel/cobalt efflux system n=1 Tax=Paracoccidioides lutzii (strain ATCC MYA-826 / Pb01) TaxID=502779 RepID=C1GVD1_PARBA|nr:hypothetical protein PAAG_02208 [Paracoccidioides lutzii Pb01]EEH40153.2 hypothetical protein PAAG_02208 [Paracoccidioides lutzii Pb01]